MVIADKKILALLQADCSLTMDQISEKVNLSKAACWRRIQRLDSEGYINKRVALLNREKLNAGVTVVVSIRAKSHSLDWYNQFLEVIKDTPEIMNAYRMSGETDYLLGITVPDIKAFDGIYQKMLKRIEFNDVTSSFAMEELKNTTEVTLNYLT